MKDFKDDLDAALDGKITLDVMLNAIKSHVAEHGQPIRFTSQSDNVTARYEDGWSDSFRVPDDVQTQEVADALRAEFPSSTGKLYNRTCPHEWRVASYKGEPVRRYLPVKGEPTDLVW